MLSLLLQSVRCMVHWPHWETGGCDWGLEGGGGGQGSSTGQWGMMVFSGRTHADEGGAGVAGWLHLRVERRSYWTYK